MDQAVSEDDRQDIAATLQGSEAAYRRLVERYEAAVYRQMWRFSRDAQVVEELTQEVFVQAYYSLAKFRSEAPFLHWLRKLATRAGYRYWQRKQREAVHREQLNYWTATQPPPESQAPREAAETLHALLALLPPKDRLVLTLYYLEDCSSQEIADRMGWSATLVRVRVHRALGRLKKKIADRGGQA